jgi:ATP-dependent Clp protease ATP-binding subunit ClpC
VAAGADCRRRADYLGTYLMEGVHLTSLRARKARLGARIGKGGYGALYLFAAVLAAGGVALLFVEHAHISYSLIGLALLLFAAGRWVQHDLLVLPARGETLDDRLSVDVLARLPAKGELSPVILWNAVYAHWQGRFVTNHLVVPSDFIANQLSEDWTRMPEVWQKIVALADATESTAIEPGHIAGGLILSTPSILDALSRLKHRPEDVAAIVQWLAQDLTYMRRPKPSFGGIGRDWASGFTPRLNQFGHNISASIERSGAHFGSLVESPGVMSIRGAFSQGSTAVALIGENGIGKTSHAYALAESVLAEHRDPNLEHKQIYTLSASSIISAAQRPGDLEYVVTMLLNEASHAGNIILFLDDAMSFFTSGPGAFNATQILLPVIQSRSVFFIMAVTPHEYQQLKSQNASFAGLLTPVVIQELGEAEVLKSLTNAASNFENRQKVLVAYEALQEAYRLSGRYEQDMAYPGKAVRLLEQSIVHSSNGIVTAVSVQAAIEQTKGVKVGSAAPVEAAQLLNLEDRIHERMINQTRAVSVVANALRRSRAGVSSPNRPIGSFLFLGPTGVGKTELAKSIAATYFSNEASMIRLDMSEYQQESDVSRLLSGGENEASSLILSIRKQPFSVVLLDEIEKAHPNVLNLLLQLLDEGQLTDTSGRGASFKDAVVIVTSNAGADSIRKRIEAGEELETFEKQFTDELISSGQFRPELLNRFDEIVLFRPLKPDELAQVVRLMLVGINNTLSTQQITVSLTDAAIMKIVEVGNDPRLGARPMRRALQRAVEDTVAKKILEGSVRPGDQVSLDAADLSL